MDPQKANAVNAQSVKPEDLQKKHLQERQRQEEELEYRIAQTRIDAMEAGAEKEPAQRELDNRREISLLRRQKDDYIQAVIRFEKEKVRGRGGTEGEERQALCEKNPLTRTRCPWIRRHLTRSSATPPDVRGKRVCVSRKVHGTNI